MNDVEIGNLICRLTGDGSEFQKMMSEAKTATEHTAKAVEEQTKKIEEHANSVKRFGENALKALEAFGATEWLREGFKGYIEAEKNQVRLSAAIEAGGHDAQKTLADYKEFAKVVAETTLTTKGETLALLQRAESFKLSGDAAKKAAYDSVALAGATGQSADSFIRITAQMAKGNIQMAMAYSRILPQLREFKDATTFTTEYNKLLAQGMKVAGAEAETTAGKLQHIEHAYEAFKKSLGAIVAEGVAPFVGMIKEASEALGKLDKGTKMVIVGVLALVAGLLAFGPAMALIGTVVAPIFSTVGIAVGIAIAAIGVWVRNTGGVEAAWKRVKASGLETWNTIQKKIEEFQAWVRPIAQALESLFTVVWNQIKSTAVSVWNTIQGAALRTWESISGSAKIEWKNIQEDIRDAIIFCEFTLQNFPKVAKQSWEEIRLYFKSMAAGIELIWDDLLSKLTIRWRNWAGWVAKAIVSLGGDDAVVREVKKIIDENNAASNAVTNNLAQTNRAAVLLELKTFEDSIKNSRKDVKDAFDKFRNEKLAEFGIGDKDHKHLEGHIEMHIPDLPQSISKGIVDGLQKADATLRHSAEALGHIRAYRESFNTLTNPLAQPGNLPMLPAAGGFGGHGGEQANNGRILGLILDEAQKLNAKSPIVFDTPLLS